MPELPEVETVVRDLRPLLAGRRVVRAWAGKEKLRRPWRPEWAAQLAGRRIDAVRRRGKWIVLDLDSGACLVLHLGMTGQLTLVDRRKLASSPAAKHTHLELDLGVRRLRFRDARRFGASGGSAPKTALMPAWGPSP